jgi:hypothetical protein
VSTFVAAGWRGNTNSSEWRKSVGEAGVAVAAQGGRDRVGVFASEKIPGRKAVVFKTSGRDDPARVRSALAVSET